MSGNISPDNEIDLLYSAVRRSLKTEEPVTVLHIGSTHTSVAVGTGAEPSSVLVLPIGYEKTGSDFFHHTPPTPEEVENAINLVEDEVTRVAKVTGPGSTLHTADASIREIARLAGVSDQPVMTLSRDEMERFFSRFAAVSMGRPAAMEKIPVDPSSAARLLILREFMHHLGCESISVGADVAGFR